MTMNFFALLFVDVLCGFIILLCIFCLFNLLPCSL